MSTLAAFITAAAAMMAAGFTTVARASTPGTASPMVAHKSIHRTASAAGDQRNAGQQRIENACHKRGLPFRMLRTAVRWPVVAAIVGSVPLRNVKPTGRRSAAVRQRTPRELSLLVWPPLTMR